jgi:hypothetical protein
MHIYNKIHSPTRFGAYCAIFRENFIVCSELLLHCSITDRPCAYCWRIKDIMTTLQNVTKTT